MQATIPAPLALPGEACGPAEWAPPVLGGPERLSKAARAEIRALSGHRPVRFLAEVALSWAVIAAAIGAGVACANPVVSLLCVVLIGIRQMVLGLLLHEQVHRLGLRGRHGDRIVNALVVYPLFATTVEDYAKVHLAHHKYFMTERDPDFVRKSGDDWRFPMSAARFLKLLATDLAGLNTVQLVKGKTARAGMDEFARPHPTPRGFRLAWFLALAATLTLVGGWGVFLTYWVLPILTVTQLCVRWTAVTEHRYDVEGADLLQVTPMIRPKPWQRLLFPDLNFALHAHHHLHPGVSFSKLPQVHAIYRREGLVDDAAIFDGQGAYLRWLVARR